jgi:hypothetical protein
MKSSLYVDNVFDKLMAVRVAKQVRVVERLYKFLSKKACVIL